MENVFIKKDVYDKTTYMFPPSTRSPWKIYHQTIHCPIANFGPLSRGSISNPILITVLDTYIDPKVTRSLGLSKDPSDSECSTLTHFSMSLAHKYGNLKEPFNQDINEQVTTIFFLKKEDRLYMKSPTQRQSVQKMLFKFSPLFVKLTFKIIYQ